MNWELSWKKGIISFVVSFVVSFVLFYILATLDCYGGGLGWNACGVTVFDVLQHIFSGPITDEFVLFLVVCYTICYVIMSFFQGKNS